MISSKSLVTWNPGSTIFLQWDHDPYEPEIVIFFTRDSEHIFLKSNSFETMKPDVSKTIMDEKIPRNIENLTIGIPPLTCVYDRTDIEALSVTYLGIDSQANDGVSLITVIFAVVMPMFITSLLWGRIKLKSK